MSLSCMFCSEEEEALVNLFKTDDLKVIAYREKVADLVPPGTVTFDLAVKINRRAVGIFRDTYIGVAYWPNGPILRGVQVAQEGQTVVFHNLSVAQGGEIVVALGDELGVEVSAQPLGYKPPPVDKSNDVGLPPELPSFGAGLSVGAILALGVVLYLVLKRPSGGG